MIVRPATSADLESVMALRMRLFSETGEALSGEAASRVEAATRDFFAKHLASATSRTWVATLGLEVAAIGTLAFFVRPPSPSNLSGQEAYLLNMYTLPAHRRQGLAKAILAQAMHFAQAAGCQKIWLHASPAGRALYESQGFRADGAYLAWTPQRC